MNCAFCNKHILATTQITWQGKNYHPDCVGEAVARYRSGENQEDAEIKEAFQDFDDDAEVENRFDAEFDEQYNDELEEDYDDLEPEEDLEQSNVIVPEIVRQIGTNGETVGSFAMPPGSMIAAPRAIIHPPSNGDKNGNGTIIAGEKGSKFVTFPELKNLPLPDATATFKPVPFYDFVTKVLDGLYDRRMRTVNEQYIISQDGMKLFGLLELEHEYDGVRFAVGLRSSNNKSMKLALACGYRVMCCSNGMLSGDFMPLSVKHSASLDIDDALALGIDRIRRRFGNVQSEISEKKAKELTDGRAESLIYKAFTYGKFPVSLFRAVHKEYFIEPSHKEFAPRTLFSLENAFTSSFKRLQPMQQFEQTSRLAKFLLNHRN